jgi:hypothetical protein
LLSHSAALAAIQPAFAGPELLALVVLHAA